MANAPSTQFVPLFGIRKSRCLDGILGHDRATELEAAYVRRILASYSTFTDDRALKLSRSAQHGQSNSSVWMVLNFPHLARPGGSTVLPNRRTAPANIGGLFEGIRHLQRPPVVVVSADDLDADGQPRLGKSTRNGNRRISNHRDVIG